ncbi:hypothetical protein BD413DRAFT_603919 [Trametes elegans]|nr:hypothetical protein BD413DRAFT_603919 [Trametes elegans]
MGSSGSSLPSDVSSHVHDTHFSNISDPGVKDSLWMSPDIMLGAGMMVIQPSTGKIVVLHETRKDWQGRDRQFWFLPKGRKDRGESLERTALREAHEESGYRVSFLPLIMETHAPLPPGSKNQRDVPCTEPIGVYVQQWRNGHHGRNDHGGEYLTFWYVGQIADDAVVEQGTRMPDEVGYQTALLTYREAMEALGPDTVHARVVDRGYRLWYYTMEALRMPAYLQYLRDIGIDPASFGAVPIPAEASARPGHSADADSSKATSSRASSI